MTDLKDPLLCPICLDTFVAEIFQCENGHCICSKCISNLLECPQCQIPYTEGKIRNRALEALVDTLTFSCPYEKHGCNEKVKRGYKDSHARKCLFKVKPVKVILCPERDEFISGQNLKSASSTANSSSKNINRNREYVDFVPLYRNMDFSSCKWFVIALMILYHLGIIRVITLVLSCILLFVILFYPT